MTTVTSPVERAAANAALTPPELTVEIGLERVSCGVISKDWRKPGSLIGSLTALARVQGRLEG